ncbi:MAG: alkaline phosphatase family protein [Candidatus Hodarchaeota archaeon]
MEICCSKPKILMIILDGFSSKYMKKDMCPNLFNLAKKYYFSKLEPMFGFQGIGAAIFSGASSNITGIFTEFSLQKNVTLVNSGLLRVLMRLTDKIPDDDLCSMTKYMLLKLFGDKRPGISNVIPYQIMSYFSPKIRKEFTEEKSLGNIKTIFDVLREYNMTYELQRPSYRNEIAMINSFATRMKSSKIPDLSVIHICSLDHIGHKYGPYSSEIKYAIKKIDNHITKLIYDRRNIITIIFSDHGLIPVTNYVDLFKILKQLPLKLEKDYLIFLDSTIARFWFFNDYAKNMIRKKLSELRCGNILSKSDMKKLLIDNIGKEYGELFFALKEGYTFFPDFFRKNIPPKGMHGYAFQSYDAPIILIHAENYKDNFKKKECVKFLDITPTLLDLFKLPTLITCEGDSLLQ